MNNRDRLWIWGAFCALGMQVGGDHASAMVVVAIAFTVMCTAVLKEKE